jgi:hypothetical protein
MKLKTGSSPGKSSGLQASRSILQGGPEKFGMPAKHSFLGALVGVVIILVVCK